MYCRASSREKRAGRFKAPLSILALVSLAFVTAPTAIGASLPRPAGYVSDYAGVLDARARAGLNELLLRLERKTGAEVAVVTVRSLDGGDIDSYASALFSEWKIGKKGKDNGVLIVVAIEERAWRIEVGYGLEGLLPDGLCGQIARERMIEPFRDGRFGDGLTAGALAVAAVIAKDAGTSLEEIGGPSGYETGARPAGGRRAFSWWRLLFFLIMIPIVIRNPWLLLFMMGGRGGGWSGGGFGGGFGGFGGGMSGGGGASGRW